MDKARVVDIKRFAVHDGDGIRTTLFLKGCTLKCVWCHNPEGIEFYPQLAYYSQKCIGCSLCASTCPTGAQKISANKHVYERNLCQACGACEKVCLGTALKLFGKEMTTGEVIPLLLEDKMFYDQSGGGITISGGEALTHPDFCLSILRAMKEHGINTAIDTCGNVPRKTFDMVIPYTDTFLYDIKAINEDTHIKCTGKSNRLILSNLEYLDSLNCRIEIRIPYVPGFNNDQIPLIAEYLRHIKNIIHVRVLAYHNYAGSKYSALGMVNTLPSVLPSDKEIEDAQELIDKTLIR